MATVRDREPGLGREAAQRLRLPGAVHDVAHQPAGEVAVDHFEAVGVGVVDPGFVGEPFDDLDEPAGHDGNGEAQPFEGLHEGPGAPR